MSSVKRCADNEATEAYPFTCDPEERNVLPQTTPQQPKLPIRKPEEL
jgi:hypothetical protein